MQPFAAESMRTLPTPAGHLAIPTNYPGSITAYTTYKPEIISEYKQCKAGADTFDQNASIDTSPSSLSKNKIDKGRENEN